MYKEFYKLQLNPFEITPDPSFLFLTKRHQEALATLYYGVHRRRGCVTLTGDVGTGKTLLIRCLLRMLKDSDIACTYVFNVDTGVPPVCGHGSWTSTIGQDQGRSPAGPQQVPCCPPSEEIDDYDCGRRCPRPLDRSPRRDPASN